MFLEKRFNRMEKEMFGKLHELYQLPQCSCTASCANDGINNIFEKQFQARNVVLSKLWNRVKTRFFYIELYLCRY